MNDPDYIVQVTVLSGDGKQKLMEWETGVDARDSYVQERLDQAGGNEAEAAALAHIHVYDLLSNPPSYLHPRLRDEMPMP